MSDSFTMALSQRPVKRRQYVPWLPLLIGVVAIIACGAWHHFSTLALADTKVIAALISIPLPKAFSTVLPALLSASLAMLVVFTVLTWAFYAWRGMQQYRAKVQLGSSSKQQQKQLAIVAGVLNGLQYFLTIWFVFMLVLSMLWFGGGMVATKATTDAVSTMSVVDQTLPRLIKTAMGIDPKKVGYLVHVAGRDVNIGTSTCSLFCFTLARALLADTIDCTCDDKLAAKLMPPGNVTADIDDSYTCSSSPVMCSINAYAYQLYKAHMKPALVAVIITVLCLMGLLSLLSGTFARLTAELRQEDSISRCSSESADADMRVSSGSEICSPSKAGSASGKGNSLV